MRATRPSSSGATTAPKLPPSPYAAQVAEPDAVFHAELDAGVERFVPSDFARGPWDPRAQHGGAPSALLARAIERHEPGTVIHVARLTVELLRPVPLSPLVVRAHTRRPGKQVQIVEASLFAGDTEVARATGLRLRRKPVGVPTTADEGPLPPLPDQGSIERFEMDDAPRFGDAMQIVTVAGRVQGPGPATVWFRLVRPIVAGEVTSPLMRVAAAADFGNGISAVVDWDAGWVFINPDLTVYLHRYPEGEWVGLDAVTHAGSEGVGLAEARLYDEEGPIGLSAQSLLLDHPGT
jgi:hypothetical protein